LPHLTSASLLEKGMDCYSFKRKEKDRTPLLSRLKEKQAVPVKGTRQMVDEAT
jgi:hypothetical protein